MVQMTTAKVEKKERKIQTAPRMQASCPPPGHSSSPSSCRSSQKDHQTLLTEWRTKPQFYTGGRISYLLRETVSVAMQFHGFPLVYVATYPRL